MNTPISGQPLFTHPANRVYVEDNFAPFPQSIVWELNSFFWAHTKLWETTFGEHFERSLPKGLSESHRPEFIESSARQFFTLLTRLSNEHRLPNTIIILEQGPGSGLYAKGFLAAMQKWSTAQYPFYDHLRYILSDTSQEILQDIQSILGDHKKQVQFFLQTKPFELPPDIAGKVLFARHSNMWEQLPMHLLAVSKNMQQELFTRAYIDTDLLQNRLRAIEGMVPTVEEIVTAIQTKKFDALVLTHPHIWKPVMEAFGLEEKTHQLEVLSYKEALSTIQTNIQEETVLTWSVGAAKNFEGLYQLIDWERDGYIEVMTICGKTLLDFVTDRRPKKYDGSIAAVVNGPFIKHIGAMLGKHVALEPVRGINTKMTIRNHHLITLLESNRLVTMAEIAIRRDATNETTIDHARKLLEVVDTLAFSDQAHAGQALLTIGEVLEKPLLDTLPTKAVIPVVVLRRKTPKEVAAITKTLKQKKIPQILLLGGDADPKRPDTMDPKTQLTTYIKRYAGQFIVAVVGRPDVHDMPRLKEKIEAGATIVFVQASYDESTVTAWVEAVQKEKLNERVHFISVLLPITSKKSYEIITSLPDVPFANSIKKEFENAPTDAVVKELGLQRTKKDIERIKKNHVFSGIYLYTKSLDVIREVLI